ncbi:MAG: SH3 domain-containing protein [Thermanaeromonas sp.]|uniref:SH3 domain-containing protein n=1 Tax=Thermanaeromonas sp. TaxID=2003697 RepID=UPI0024407FE1|nr:SH3 domain-containing protein [Thermanaeromonas sp.]MCG0277157.1 SH3 domain-containing protein [Thermanaeromonas sp.]
MKKYYVLAVAAGLLSLAFIFVRLVFYLPLARTPYEARGLAVATTSGEEIAQILKEIVQGETSGIKFFKTEGDLAPLPGKEVVIGANLSKDRGVLGLFSLASSPPQLLTYRAILPVEEVKVLKLEPGREGVLVREVLEERFGAYFLTRFYSLYVYQEGAWQEAWRKVIDNDEKWQKKWVGRGEGWEGIKDKVEVEFNWEGGRLVARTQEIRVFWEGPHPEHPPTSTKERALARLYKWEPKWGALILGEGEVGRPCDLKEQKGGRYVKMGQLKPGERVAILDEEEAWGWTAYMGEATQLYRIKTLSGSTGYVTKEDVRIHGVSGETR